MKQSICKKMLLLISILRVIFGHSRGCPLSLAFLAAARSRRLSMQPAEPYILKSELAMRRHAVLMPADVPAAKRRRTAGSAEPSACARAHAFVSDSPLSPSKAPRPVSPAAQTHNHETIDSPVESPDVSTGEAATFAVRTDSELEPVSAPPAAQATAEDAQADLGVSPKDHLQNASRPPESDTNPDSRLEGATETSQQQSTADAEASAPSTVSYETSLRAAVSAREVDGPSSPHVPSFLGEVHGVEAPAAMPAAQPSTPPIPTVSEECTTVPQLLLLGPYHVDAEQQKSVAQNLQMYKARVDEVHALGRVRQHDCRHGCSRCCTEVLKADSSTLRALPAAETRHDCVQGAQRAVEPTEGAWTYTRG